jgi:cation:H+ antiporter
MLSVFGSFPLSALAFVFALAAGAVWVAGIRLSDTTDVLLERFGLGQALGGLILLAVVTNLPEIAITASASLSGELGIAVGNILGGIAIQTAVLVLVDAFGVRGGRPLSYRAASLSLVLEGTLVIGVLAVTVMSSQLPSSVIFGRVTPGGLLIVVCWGAGIVLLYKAQTRLPWSEEREPPGSQRVPKGTARARKDRDARNKGISTNQTLAFFAVASVITLVAGVALEQSGEIIAGRIGMNGILFGSTVLAAATALPEVSTGLASAKLGDYQLAISDIFGGNAFLPVLFFLAGLLSGQAVFPELRDTDMYLIGLGVVLTCVYIFGLIFRPRRTVLRMGLDSLVVLALYLLGTAGLALVGQG